MMDFRLSEKELALKEKVAKFAKEKVLPGVIERDEKAEASLEIYKELGTQGFLDIFYPKELGGQGEDYLSYAIIVEELSKVDSALSVMYSASASLYGGSVLYSSASDELKKKFSKELLKGDAVGSFGLTEPNAGSDAGGCITIAKKDGDSYIINGLKCFNTNGPLADYTAVYALTEPEKKSKGLSCFIVPKKTEGVSVGRIENKMGIRSAQVSELNFDNVRVPAENMITKSGDGFKLAMIVLDSGRIGVAAQAMGLCEGAFERAVEYMKQREQFGKPIFKNQYLSFEMAELKMQMDTARMILYKAISEKNRHESFTQTAAMAKYLCTNAAMNVTERCVQFMGGNGYMREYHVERMMRDAKVTQIYEGTNEIQKLIIGNNIFR